MTGPTVAAEAAGTELFGTPVSDLQTNVSVSNGAITVTLKFYDDADADLVKAWGEGNFIALKFTNIDPNATSVKVGLDPSYGNGLVEIINDPDKNGAFKITDKDNQVFKVVTTDGTKTTTDTYTLSGLTVQTA